MFRDSETPSSKVSTIGTSLEHLDYTAKKGEETDMLLSLFGRLAKGWWKNLVDKLKDQSSITSSQNNQNEQDVTNTLSGLQNSPNFFYTYMTGRLILNHSDINSIANIKYSNHPDKHLQRRK